MSGFDLFTPPQRDEPDTPIERAPAPVSQLSQPEAKCSTTPPRAARDEKPRETAPPVSHPRPRPPSVAPVASVAEGIGFMLALKKPRGIKVRRFNHLQKDLQAFERVWLEKALAMGWTLHDLFGCWHNPLAGRVDCDGLLHLLQGRKIEELHADRAVILAEKRLGHRLTFRRGAGDRSHGALLWHAYAALPQVLIEGEDE